MANTPNQGQSPERELPAPDEAARKRGSGQPGGGHGRVDVTGTTDVRPTGDWEEGKPGYDESGSSEILPPGTPPPGEKPQDVKPE